jgi:branched-chain amino acid transport system substrate-binding protein
MDRRSFAMVARWFAVATLTAVVGAGPLAAGAAGNLPTYEINAIVPLTGSGAFLGKSHLDTFRALEHLVNASGGIGGRPIKFIVSDTQTSGPVDIELVNGLIAKHVPVFLDGAPSTVCNPSIPLVAKSGPVDYCLTPSIHPPAGGYVFSSGAATLDLASVAIRYLRERGWKRLAMVTSTDSTGQDLFRQVQAVLALPENTDVTLVDEERFNPNDIGVAAQIAKIKAANAQAVMVWTTGTPLGTVLRAISDAGLSTPVLTNNSNMTYAQMSAYAAYLPKELYFPSLRSLTPAGTLSGPLLNAQAQYLRAFRSINVRPDAGDALAWDPAMIVISALRKLGTGATAEQIRDYILNLHGWIGSNGVYDFSSGDQRGIGQNSIIVARWAPEKGTWIQVSRPNGLLK